MFPFRNMGRFDAVVKWNGEEEEKEEQVYQPEARARVSAESLHESPQHLAPPRPGVGGEPEHGYDPRVGGLHLHALQQVLDLQAGEEYALPQLLGRAGGDTALHLGEGHTGGFSCPWESEGRGWGRSP